jgi:uncharacterized protein (TIGR04255 family)
MATFLTVDDFKPFTITCELRFKNAYLLFDRTGAIVEDLRGHFTDINVTSASPQVSAFTSGEGYLHLELGACRFTSGRFDKNSESFAKHCKNFFDIVTERIQINIYTRIGLRYILRKEFKTEDDAKAALASCRLANLKPTRRFNSSDSPTEVMFRWEDAQIGAMVRLKAETTEVKVQVPIELQEAVPAFEKKTTVLTIDTDYYTVAPVEREQWTA